MKTHVFRIVLCFVGISLGMYGGEASVFPWNRVKQISIQESSVLSETEPASNEKVYVKKYEHRMEVEGDENARLEQVSADIDRMKVAAFKAACAEIQLYLDQKIGEDDYKLAVQRATERYRDYLVAWNISGETEQGVGSVFKKKWELRFTVTFQIDIQKLRADLAGRRHIISERSEAGLPSTDDHQFVEIFRDKKIDWTPDFRQGPEMRWQSSLDKAIRPLQEEAFRHAAERVLSSINQPQSQQEFKKTINLIMSNARAYFVREPEVFKLIVKERGRYAKGAESALFSVAFFIDLEKLKNTLLKERAVVPVAKYKTFVELYWNVPGKEIRPEICQSMIENVESYFSEKGYEVIEFDQIKFKLVEMLKNEGKNTEDLFSENELTRFKANLELRDIDNSFQNGKRILADYADIVIGVTINSLDITPDRMLRSRVTVNSMLVERGNWVTLPSADAMDQLPFVSGVSDIYIQLVRSLADKACQAVEPKIRQKIGARKTVQTVKLENNRDFTLVFKDFSKSEYTVIKRKLMNGTKWEFQDGDLQARIVRLAFKGTKDSLADYVGMYLEGAEIAVDLPEYSEDGRKILFPKAK